MTKVNCVHHNDLDNIRSIRSGVPPGGGGRGASHPCEDVLAYGKSAPTLVYFPESRSKRQTIIARSRCESPDVLPFPLSPL